MFKMRSFDFDTLFISIYHRIDCSKNVRGVPYLFRRVYNSAKQLHLVFAFSACNSDFINLQRQ